MFLTQRGGLGMKDGMMNSMNQKLEKKYIVIKKGSLYQKRNGENKIDNVIGYKN